MAATPKNLMFLIDSIPTGSTWSAIGASKDQLTINTMSILLGGHVRVGMEDSVYYRRGELATTNAQFVKRIVELSNTLGREVATPDEAREILQLSKKLIRGVTIMKIGVLGVGSLGTIIGALITKGGYDVDLIDINQENVDALNQNGAKLTGFLDETVVVKAKHPNEVTRKYDVIFLLTKQVYTKDSLESILPFLNEDSVVCTLQNGIPEESVAAIVGKERTIGGVVGFGAT